MILHFTAGNNGNLSEIGEKLSTLKDGEYVIEVTKNRPIRSLSSLRYLFGVVYKTMAIKTGMNTDELHEAMKYKFLAQNIQTPSGVWITTIGTTKNMTDAEMAQFTEKVKAFAEKYLMIQFVDQRDVTYENWSKIREGYDGVFNRMDIDQI